MHDSGDVLELKKDICQPGKYLRAGARKTKGEWLALYPDGVNNYADEWFINITRQKPQGELTIERYIVETVFKAESLSSIAYKDAAVKCIEEFKKYINQIPPALA